MISLKFMFSGKHIHYNSKKDIYRGKDKGKKDQWIYGTECLLSSQATTVKSYIHSLWQKIDIKSEFHRKNKSRFQKLTIDHRDMKKKKDTCPFLKDIAFHLTFRKDKNDGKIYYKKLDLI